MESVLLSATGKSNALDGGHSVHTNRTHYTFTELIPNTEQALAVGDGKTLNTAALQQAFTDCGPNDEVYFPAGIYLTGALDLHSCMSVCLEKDAVLQGSSDPTDYLPRIWSRFEGTEQECYRSLLNAGHLDHTAGANCENILLYGKGTISGGGHVLAERMIDIERENLRISALVATCENIFRDPAEKCCIHWLPPVMTLTHCTIRRDPCPEFETGRLINLSNCSRIRITGLTLQNGAAFPMASTHSHVSAPLRSVLDMCHWHINSTSGIRCPIEYSHIVGLSSHFYAHICGGSGPKVFHPPMSKLMWA